MHNHSHPRLIALIVLLFGLKAQASTTRYALIPEEDSPFSLKFAEDRPRSDILAPAFSFFVPGFDQWWEGQYLDASLYTGAYLAGGFYSSHHLSQMGEDRESRIKRRDELLKDPYSKDFHFRRYRFGAQLSQSIGGFSSYHAFRTAVRSRWQGGGYAFLKDAPEESVGELLLAPFRFDFLSRASTYVPIFTILALAAYDTMVPEEELAKANLTRSAFTGEDFAFSGLYSFNAGTHEEAMFRGWLLPLSYEYTGSRFWGNALTSIAFSLAHLNTVSFPIVQLLLGYHLGDTTMQNNWSLKESIFIHTWWNVVAFSSIYSRAKKNGDKEALSRLSLSVPILALTF